MSEIHDASGTHDVAIIGGGPGGSTAGNLLAQAGRRVVLFERERFPRFHIGESLLPHNMRLFDRLGLTPHLKASFMEKWGIEFVSSGGDLRRLFHFDEAAEPRYPMCFQVRRSEFDHLLLREAARRGCEVRQEAEVRAVAAGPDGVWRLSVAEANGAVREHRARFLVDASGRDGFLAGRLGRRVRVPNLGKVALFAHYRGADRFPGVEEGNVRIYLFAGGWFWWIPMGGDLTSIGVVLHARVARAHAGAPEALFEAMVQRCRAVADHLGAAERVTPIHRTANFAYTNTPVVGDRFLVVGDAIAFVDPIFSSGVFIAMRTAELAADTILAAFADGRFNARRFAAYERRVWRGMSPFFTFINKYYEPAFLDLFLRPRNVFGMVRAVLNVLSGGSFIRMPLRVRLSLTLLFGLARINTWVRRRAGRPVESRLEW